MSQRGSSANILRYPANISNVDLNPGLIQFKYFEKTPEGAKIERDVIQLGMPDTISSPSTISWDTEKFGMAGEIANQQMQNIQGMADNKTFSAADYTDAVAQRVTKGGTYNLLSSVSSALGGTATADGLMQKAEGVIPNPYLQCIFRGVDFRTFQYQFKFTPLSLSDCDTILEIYTLMRAYSLPNTAGGDVAPFLNLPYQCVIGYFWKGQPSKFLHKFKDAACTAIDIDYSAGGYFSAMRNGFPSQITITTRWSEMEIVTRDDVLIGGY